MKMRELIIAMQSIGKISDDQAALLLIEEIERELEELRETKRVLSWMAYPNQEARPLGKHVYEKLDELAKII